MPFEIFMFCTARIVELALRKDLSDQQILDEMRKIHDFEKELKRLSDAAQPKS